MDNSASPKRTLNFLQASSVIIGAVIGSGVFLNLPIVAKYAGSPLNAVLIWFIGGLFWIPQILILAEMGTAYPDQGGPYAYLNKAGSPFLAFMYTWTAFLTSDTPTITIIALTAASLLSFFYPVFGGEIEARLFASALILMIAILQIRSVKIGGRIQVLLSIAKILPLLMIVIIGFFYLGSGNLKPASETADNSWSFESFSGGISATLWAYAGFLNLLYMAGEIKNPQKTIPQSLIGSIVFVIVAYTVISLTTSAIVPYNILISKPGEFINPFLYVPLLSDNAGWLFNTAAFISMLGVLNSVIMTQPRLEYAMAKDKLFFRQFGVLHEKYLTPYVSIIIQALFAILLFLLGDLENMLGYFTLSYVLQNALVYGAVFFLPARSDYKPSFKTPLRKTMATIAILIQLFTAYGAYIAYPTAGLIACGGLIITGFPLYLFFLNQKKKFDS